MTKRLSISISDHVFDTYLKDIEINKSQYIEKMLMIGSEAIVNNEINSKAKLIQLIQEKHNLEEEIKKLKLLNGSLKSKLDKNDYDEEREKAEQLTRNILHNQDAIFGTDD